MEKNCTPFTKPGDIVVKIMRNECQCLCIKFITQVILQSSHQFLRISLCLREMLTGIQSLSHSCVQSLALPTLHTHGQLIVFLTCLCKPCIEHSVQLLHSMFKTTVLFRIHCLCYNNRVVYTTCLNKLLCNHHL